MQHPALHMQLRLKGSHYFLVKYVLTLICNSDPVRGLHQRYSSKINVLIAAPLSLFKIIKHLLGGFNDLFVFFCSFYLKEFHCYRNRSDVNEIMSDDYLTCCRWQVKLPQFENYFISDWTDWFMASLCWRLIHKGSLQQTMRTNVKLFFYSL